MGTFGSATPATLTVSVASSAFPLAPTTYTESGMSVPANSLDRWFAARNRSDQQLVEVVIKGDSTFAGQTTPGDTVHYSPATRLRELLNAAGYRDGGHGWNNGPLDTPHLSGDAVSGTSGVVGFTSSDSFTLPGASLSSATANDTVTFSGYGTTIRLFYRRYTLGGRFTYSVDGGAAVTVDPVPPTGSTTAYAFILISGLTDGLHTVTVVNSGGRVIIAPSFNASATSAGTANPFVPTGTYYYKMTTATASGETLPTAAVGPVSVTSNGTPNGNTIGGTITNAVGATSYKVYRSTTSGGTYGLVATITDSGGTFTSWADTATSVGAAPPSTDTSGLNTATANVNVGCDFIKSTGIVIHNHAVRGQGSGSGNIEAQSQEIQFGLAGSTTATTAAGQARDTTPGARAPVLVIYALGINDQQGHGGTDTSSTLRDNCIAAGNAARAAGADFLILIPAFETANQSQLAANYRQGLKDAATTLGAPWIDIGMGGALPALTAGSTSNDPHLTEAQYITQGNYIWNKALGRR